MIYQRFSKDLEKLFNQYADERVEIVLSREQAFDIVTKLGFVKERDTFDLELWDLLWRDICQRTGTETPNDRSLKVFLCAIQNIYEDWMSEKGENGLSFTKSRT
jgi:hypothetical protein